MPSQTPKLTALDHLVLTVADLSETVKFYTEALGMEVRRFRATDGSNRWALYFGQQKINLHQAGAEFDPKARHPGPGTADLCFLTATPLADWQAHLAAQSVEIEDGPIARSGAAGAITSIYIRDPDGNLIEVSTQD
jgi:catechol 2,3-dioxygenase-like lactoylglutathione lyase family enzyme